MIFDQSVKPYLKREKFINSLHVNLPKEAIEIPRRIDHIINLTKGKKVLHMGCCDHVPLIKDKIERNTWLHKLLTEECELCIGIDIDKEALLYVKDDLGFNNVHYADITESLPAFTKSEKWDYIILGEILEHIDNPVEFLSKLKANCPNVKQILISVPNVMNIDFMRHMKKGIEAVNSDHRYWFTPYTGAMVMTLAEIDLVDINFTDRVPLSILELLKRKITSVFRSEKHPYYYSRSIVLRGNLT